MTRQHTSDFTRRFPAIAISIVAIVAVFTAVLGEGTERYIYTFAGTGVSGGDVGDGAPATEAQLDVSLSIQPDGLGNYYLADTQNNRIRRIDGEGVITTIAGTGEGGFGGDGGPATEAQLSFPRGLALDESGNLYVADSGNNRIRRIDAEGVITTIAGTGGRGSGGDGGPATEAQLASPSGLALDGSDNLYVADNGNNRIRRIDAEGVITTIAGTGEGGFGGDGGPATEAQLLWPAGLTLDGSGDLYVADSGNNRIRQIDAEGVITTIAGTEEFGFGGDGGPATEAQLNYPVGLALDGSGNLYVSDSLNFRIRVIKPSGERNPVTQEFPQFANGDSTVSDIVLVNVDTKTVTPVVRFHDSEGDPVSADSVTDLTEGLDLMEDGALSVSAAIPPLGERTISTHGRGKLTTGSVRVVSDGYIGGVLRFKNMAVGVAGVGAAEPVNDALFPARRQEDGINAGAAFRNLESEAMTISCYLMQGGEVLDTAMLELVGGGQLARFINELFPDADTSEFVGSVRCAAPEGQEFTGVALEMDIHNRVFTTLPFVELNAALRGDVEERYVFTFAGKGVAGGDVADGGSATVAQLNVPLGVQPDESGNLYVADNSNNRVRRIDAEGVITTIAGTGERGFGGDGGPATAAQLSSPIALTLDGSHNLYVADFQNHRIRRIDAEGVITTIAGTGERGFGGDGGPATEAQLSGPASLALDGSGNLYVGDAGNFRIRRIDVGGVITTIAGTGEYGFGGDGGPATEAQVTWPVTLVLDRSDNIYVSDHQNNRIRRIDAEGVITTIAGTGKGGFGGDGGPAKEAQLHWPRGLALDGADILYVADVGNDRIRRIDADGVITTIAGTGERGFGGDGGPATKARFLSLTGLALDGSGNLYVADSGNYRIRVIRPPGERNPVTQEFPQFANGDSTVSDLVLVNVDTKTVTPVVRFFDSEGDPVSADSVTDLTEDLELTEDGALSVTAGIPPLGERTISTHGRGELTTGSVRVIADGYIGGVLRFENMNVGVAGVGAAEPVNDALFPARRKEDGINTGAAVRNLEAEALTLTCQLMQDGEVLETATLELAGNGQRARFINELFPDADTSDFVGSVRCTAPEGNEFAGVALEMDIQNRLFTTLPLVPVAR